MKINKVDIESINFNDGKKRILILGNGSSRLEYMDFVHSWKGEIWGCNSIYKEIVSGHVPPLDAITGDKVALKEAIRVKNIHGYDYTVWSRSPATFGIKGTVRIGVPQEHVYDSGTTLVCKALLENYQEIYLVGFDLGGEDIHVPDHRLRNKSSWVIRWRKLANSFGLDRITFIGVDHKEFILSQKPADMYAQVYMKGQNHLNYDYDHVEKISNDVLILGNGKSRTQFDSLIKNWRKELWVCNEAYVESKVYNVTRVNSVHEKIICAAYDFRVKQDRDYELFCLYDVPGLKGKVHKFREKRGWSTGALSVCQAILEDFDDIMLLGFDFGGPDLYKDYEVTGDNFKKQFIEMKRLYPSFKKKVKFLGVQPEFLDMQNER